MKTNGIFQGTLIQATALTGVKEAIISLGSDPALIFQALDIDPDIQDKPNAFIPYHTHCLLLKFAAETLSCPFFGALVGSCQDLDTLGPIGHLMKESATVEDALRSLNRYHSLYNQAVTLSLETSNGSIFVNYDIQVQLNSPGLAEQALYKAAIAWTRFMQMLCGDESWTPNFYSFNIQEPIDSALLCDFFGAPVRFLQKKSGWAFDAAILSKGIDRHQGNLREVLTQYLDGLRRTYPRQFSSQVSSVIRSLLSTGDCTKEHVATLFNMSSRTLQRKLENEDLSFRLLLESIRKDTFEQYARNSDLSMTHIAGLLGFSDSSSFSRSFKMWYGVSPRQWMKLH